MTTNNNSAVRDYVPPSATRAEPSLLLVRTIGRFGRVHFRAITLVIGWFALLFVGLWSEMAAVAALQRAMNRATFLHNSPLGHDVKPFRW